MTAEQGAKSASPKDGGRARVLGPLKTRAPDLQARHLLGYLRATGIWLAYFSSSQISSLKPYFKLVNIFLC